MTQDVTLLTVAATTFIAGLAIGVFVQRRRQPRDRAQSVPSDLPHRGDIESLRAQALEAAAEPILIVGRDGRVLDCNAAALVMLDRHRSTVAEVEAAALRRLMSPSGAELEWPQLIAARAPWAGEARVRLLDGSRRVSTARLVPLFARSGEVEAMVEVFRMRPVDSDASVDRFLRALDSPAADDADADPAMRAQRELVLLQLGFSDLDRVLRQYATLLPAIGAEDPLSEAIAGLAAETSGVATSANVPRLLREIPRSIERLHLQLQRLTNAGSSTDDGDDGPSH